MKNPSPDLNRSLGSESWKNNLKFPEMVLDSLKWILKFRTFSFPIIFAPIKVGRNSPLITAIYELSN